MSLFVCSAPLRNHLNYYLLGHRETKINFQEDPVVFLLRGSFQPMGGGQSIITPGSDVSEQNVFISNLKLVLSQHIDFILSK